MFGFGNDKNEKKVDSAKETVKWSAIHDTFGTTDVDEVLKQYMPELSGAILTNKDTAENIERHVIQQGKNQIAIADTVMSAINELKKQNEDVIRKNRELQAKYDALVERMASVLESDRGKGR